MTILVIGATGNVGRPTVAGLLAKGEKVRALSRSEENIAKLPEGVEGVIGDLETGEGLAAACEGVDGVFLITSNGETESERGVRAVEAAKAAGVKRIVFLSVGNPDKEPGIPHYKAKLPIEAAIKDSGMDYTILRCNFFMQTDLSVVGVAKDHGVYAMPIGTIGNNRVDARDIADAAINALTEDGHAGKEYPLHGPDNISGPDAAAIYAKHFGRDVVYGGDDVDAWGKPVEAFLPPWLLNSLKTMFLAQQQFGGTASAEEVAQSEAAVGHPLRSFDDFVKELA